MVTTNASGSISFDGLASGLKTNEIVESMVEAHKAPMRQLDKRESVLEAHKSAYEEISTLATALDEATKAMGQTSTFVTHEARSSNEDVLKVSAGQGARPGIYRVDVQQLATGQRSLSSPQTSYKEASTLNAGRVTWHVDQEDFFIDIAAQASLSDVADHINDLAGHVSAVMLFDGDSYRLQLTGTDVGTKNAVVFDPDGTGLDLADPAFLVQPAQDAVFVLDGVTKIKRHNNVVNDVLEGLTFVLEDEGTGVHVKVTEDRSAMGDQIKTFVEAYNTLVTAIAGHTHFEGKHDPKKLSGDTTLNNLMRSLQQAVSRPVGQGDASAVALTGLGISTARDGRMVLDEAAMTAAITRNSAQVSKLFGRDFVRNTPGVAHRVHEVVRAYAAPNSGLLHNKSKSIELQNQTIVRRRGQLQIQADKYEEGLRKQFTDLEKNMSKLKSQNSFLESQANNRKNQ